MKKLLDDYQFMRVHRSFLVNLHKIREYRKKEAGVVLTNGHIVEVSKNRKEALLGKLSDI